MSKPTDPVKPRAVEMVFIYGCPFCGREIPLISPTNPIMVRCDVCVKQFPIVPVEKKTIAYIKLMLSNGEAAVDPDFL